MNANEEKVVTWKFVFGLESEDGSPVARGQADVLFQRIIDWAEASGMLIGGGYRPDDN